MAATVDAVVSALKNPFTDAVKLATTHVVCLTDEAAATDKRAVRAVATLCVRFFALTEAAGMGPVGTRRTADARALGAAWLGRNAPSAQKLAAHIRLYVAAATATAVPAVAARGARVFFLPIGARPDETTRTRIARGAGRMTVAACRVPHLVRVKMQGAAHLVLLGIHRHAVFRAGDVRLATVAVPNGTGAPARFVLQEGSVYIPGKPGYEPIACQCGDWKHCAAAAAMLGCKHMIGVRARLPLPRI